MKIYLKTNDYNWKRLIKKRNNGRATGYVSGFVGTNRI